MAVKSELVWDGSVIAYCLLRGAGAALPIFPRKRPRMALMAFSNSQSSSEHVTQHRRQDKSSYVFTAAEGKENSGGYNRSGKETTKWR